jgi:7-cyano-7-deazaguanine reductase
MSLTQLGHPTKPPESPDAAMLETVPNPHPGLLYLVRFTCPEFTSLCPIKSLKLFLGAFRNHAAFHEDCTLAIARRLIHALAPRWLRIGGFWYPRGGIPIDIFYQTGEPPAGLWLPDPGVAPYRGRG